MCFFTHSLTLSLAWFQCPGGDTFIDVFNAQAAALNIKGGDGQLCMMEEDHDGKLYNSAPHYPVPLNLVQLGYKYLCAYVAKYWPFGLASQKCTEKYLCCFPFILRCCDCPFKCYSCLFAHTCLVPWGRRVGRQSFGMSWGAVIVWG